MGYSFEARFSQTRLDLVELLHQIDDTLPGCGLTFTGSAVQLFAHNGWPTVETTEFAAVGSLPEVARIAGSWWGVGLEYVSHALLDGLGRNTAAEVYVNVFRAPDLQWTMSYLESSVAADYRIGSPEAAANLSAMQLAVCEAGGFDLSIYDEENHNRAPVPTLRNAEVAVKRIASDPKLGDLSVAVSSKLMSHERACSLAGPRAEEVKVSIAGYVLFPFLAPTVDRG
ncbi:hypothetical protein [Enhygromyxa salina]|uniref:Uncharacterized protein n=1 Tax=Enhygromyxa salina TaxID=215803 RepID=A0A2S9Y0Q8_9BACT|nr:hypothetical protein [Enhygromyxa salina]PRP98560.1 hypothetical protein ENSA7_65030 [Enhygromyxa salina]